MVSACVDARTGNVLIPGFYDEVQPLTPAEERAFVESGFSVESFQRDHISGQSSVVPLITDH